MSFLIFWLLSIVGTITTEVVMVFDRFKYLGENGYKINVNNYQTSGYKSIINSNKENKNALLQLIIPGLNLLTAFKETLNYIINKEDMLFVLKETGAAVEMNRYEKAKFLSKPTGINALLVACESEIEERGAETIEVPSSFGTITIKSNRADNLEEFIVFDVTGPGSRLNKEELFDMINTRKKEIANQKNNKYGFPKEESLYDMIYNDFPSFEERMENIRKFEERAEKIRELEKQKELITKKENEPSKYKTFVKKHKR